MQVKIERFDHQGQGIAYVNNKITFVPKTIPEDIVDIEIVKENKKYNQGKVIKIVSSSPLRIKAFCPFYNQCGGCDLQNLNYEDTLNYKKEKVKNIFKRINLNVNPKIIANPNPLHYRNKIELKIKNNKIGFYQKETNNIVPITKCLITKDAINEIIPLLVNLNLTNASVIIKCNYLNEILISITTKEQFNWQILKNNSLIKGIIINNKKVYGNDFLIEKINNLKYKISSDAFFQVNPNVASLLFKQISEHISLNGNVLDLYCGVGPLTLNAALKTQKTCGIEIVSNAILNAFENAKLNNINNVNFICGDVEKKIEEISDEFDTWIVDPPRKGLDNKTIAVILKNLPKKIIYVSCNVQTLVRDIEFLKDKYKLKKIYIFDMFSYTYHEECLAILDSD